LFMKKVFVTGAAGFIGSNLVDRLLNDGYEVVGWDNLSTGKLKFLENAFKHSNFKFVNGDNLNIKSLTESMAGCDTVFHLAANADVRFGLDHPSKDLNQNTIATFNILEAMRKNGIRRIVFSSTGSVYGESTIIPTPEDAPFPIQTSLYGASKVAGECLIQAYSEGYGFESYIFRFVSILGERYTHGHVFDFYKQLIDHPDYLNVLGDGTQKKSYLYVQDCIDAIIHTLKLDTKNKVNIYNLGTNEYVEVNDSVRFITNHLGLNPKINYSGGNKGWIGDNPLIFLDTKKIRNTGWNAKLTIEKGIISTLNWLQKNDWVYNDK
jgi:UDP-glucose 4-epimerase